MSVFENKESSLRFIIALTQHRILGYVLLPFLISETKHGAFYVIESAVIKQYVDDEPWNYTPAQRELVKLTDKYSDENLAKRFSKEKSITTFYNNIETKYFNEHVFPYIDTQIVACIDIIKKHNIGLYYKPVKYNNIYDEDKIEIEQKPAEAVFHFTSENDGFNYRLQIKQNDRVLKIVNRSPVVLTNSPCRLVMHNRLYWFERLTAKRIFPFLKKESISVPSAVKEKYLKTFVHGIISDNDVKGDAFDIKNVESEKKAIILIEQDMNLEPIMVLVFQYGSKQFKAGRPEGVKVELINEKNRFVFYKHTRDFKWEKSIVTILADFGFELVGDMLQFALGSDNYSPDDNYRIIRWVNENGHNLEKHGICVEQNMPQKYYTGTIQLIIESRYENDWFDVYAMVHIDKFEIPFIYFKKNILEGRREYILPNGNIAILPAEWFNNYSNLIKFSQGSNTTLKLAKHHYSIIKDSGINMLMERAEKIFENINNKYFPVFEQPKTLKASLRNYQLQGYSWMRQLCENNMGACLADDMGLGKTIQTLALLLFEKEQSVKAKSKIDQTGMESLFDEKSFGQAASLIVLPTSLVHNWENEIRKFAPSLKVYRHVGMQRRRDKISENMLRYYDVFLSTYGTIRNDYRLLENFEFNYIILDESQNIKNSDSKTYKAVCALKSHKKIVLTGTPIENSLSDLWSQFNFINKGLLGSAKFFKKEFIQPIEKGNDEEKQTILFKLIDPFILRRTKEQVAGDLPPKTESVQFCPMSEIQFEIYQKEKNSIRNTLLLDIEKNGVAKSSFLILQGLTRLRQLANHPALLHYDNARSGKFDMVIEHLSDLLAQKHKVLIFSSFVKHLQLFETEFRQRGWGYSMLTGKTRDRKKAIDEFQNDTEKRFFLISLKAGGVGLNLTAADYIMILDPWWNPAAENQAISRAHRIGQNKKVFVYRYITESSIEEKILKLQEQKAALAELFIRSKSPFDGVNADEVMELFE